MSWRGAAWVMAGRTFSMIACLALTETYHRHPHHITHTHRQATCKAAKASRWPAPRITKRTPFCLADGKRSFGYGRVRLADSTARLTLLLTCLYRLFTYCRRHQQRTRVKGKATPGEPRAALQGGR